MKLIVDLPEAWEKCNMKFIKDRIRNGTPLPKGHGALKDADAIWESMKKHRYSDGFCVAHDIDYSINLEMSGIVLRDAKTIIEADEEEADGNSN